MQLRDAALADCYGLDDRHAELPLQRLRVELEPVSLRKVDHVQRDYGRQAKLDQLQRKAKVIVEVRRVEHDDQRVGLTLALLPPEQDVACNCLIRTGRLEAV